MNELYTALINFQPSLAASYTRQELEDQIVSMIERLRFAAIMAEGRDV